MYKGQGLLSAAAWSVSSGAKQSIKDYCKRVSQGDRVSYAGSRGCNTVMTRGSDGMYKRENWCMPQQEQRKEGHAMFRESEMPNGRKVGSRSGARILLGSCSI